MKIACIGLALLLPLAGCGRDEAVVTDTGVTSLTETAVTGLTDTATTSPDTMDARLDTTATDTASAVRPQLDVQVALVDYRIDMPASLLSGPVTFNVTNSGSHEHSFEIEGEGIEKKLDRPLQPGQSAQLRAELRSGTYKVYCPVADHEGRGMTRQLVVQ